VNSSALLELLDSPCDLDDFPDLNSLDFLDDLPWNELPDGGSVVEGVLALVDFESGDVGGRDNKGLEGDVVMEVTAGALVGGTTIDVLPTVGNDVMPPTEDGVLVTLGFFEGLAVGTLVGFDDG